MRWIAYILNALTVLSLLLSVACVWLLTHEAQLRWRRSVLTAEIFRAALRQQVLVEAQRTDAPEFQVEHERELRAREQLPQIDARLGFMPWARSALVASMLLLAAAVM